MPNFSGGRLTKPKLKLGIDEYRQVSNIRRTKSQHFSYRLVAVFAESLKARC